MSIFVEDYHPHIRRDNVGGVEIAMVPMRRVIPSSIAVGSAVSAILFLLSLMLIHHTVLYPIMMTISFTVMLCVSLHTSLTRDRGPRLFLARAQRPIGVFPLPWYDEDAFSTPGVYSDLVTNYLWRLGSGEDYDTDLETELESSLQQIRAKRSEHRD